MKIAFGVVFAILGLAMFPAGRRSRLVLAIAALIFAYGGYLLFAGIKAWRTEKLVIAFIGAAERGDLPAVRLMADSYPSFINASQTIEGGSEVKWPLTVAAKELHGDVVEFLLTRGAIVDADNDDGATALHEAGANDTYGDESISVQRLATLHSLLAHGANVNARDSRQRTPLMSNARDAKAMALLIDHRADVKAKDSSGRTALHYAATSHWNTSDSITLLLDRGSEVDTRDRYGNTPFLLAGSAGNAENVETLVARGADPKARDTAGDTALHLAARSPMNLYSDLQVLAVLCANGLRPDLRDHAAATPLGLAQAGLAGERSAGWMKGRKRIVTFLDPGGPCTRLAGATKKQRAFVVAGMRCAEDDRGGCAALAWDYDTGEGTTVDQARAAELWDKACRLGSRTSCTNLAYDFDHGEGVVEDPQHAATLYGQMCDAGEMRACYFLGLMTSSGRGVAKDEARAAALFRRACAGGESNACERAGG